MTRPRLNPFAFPSDTAFRFGLLVVAVLGANLYVWQWISTVNRDFSSDREAALACLGQTANGADAFSACVAGLYRYQVAWMLLGTLGLLVVAAALLGLTPWWIERRRKLRPLTEADAPAVVAAVRELAAEQGIDPPRLRWNPLDSSSGGLAYGHPGRYSVAISGGLVVKQIADPPAFRAVVRHELAHIKNRDVGITYSTVSIWFAFLAVAIVPFTLTLFDEADTTVWSLVWRLGVLAALVYLTRNAVLRSREVYADLRASVHDGEQGGLRRVLEGLSKPAPGILARLRRVHPDPERRLAAIEDTRPLFPLGAIVAFTAGLSATIAYESIVSLFSSYFSDPIDLRFAAALAFAPLVIGIVGVGIWREAFAAHADGREPAPPWVDGLALAAGLMLGPELALERAVTADDSLVRDLFSFDGLVWAVALIGGILVLVAWIRASASAWLRALGGRRSYTAATTGLLAATGALTAFIGAFYALRGTREVLAVSRAAAEQEYRAVDAQAWAVPLRVWQFVMDGQLLVIVQKPYVVPILAVLCLYPLLTLLVRNRPDSAPWAFLDPGGVLRTPKPALRPLEPLAIGCIAGVACLAVLALLRLGVHYGASAATRDTDAAVLSFYVTTVAVALLAQLAAGTITAWRQGLIGALGAAFVAGAFGWLGVVGGPAVGGCIDPLSLNPGPCAWTVPAAFSWDVFKQVVAEGAFVGLIGAVAAIAVHDLLARRRRHADEVPSAASAVPR